MIRVCSEQFFLFFFIRFCSVAFQKPKVFEQANRALMHAPKVQEAQGSASARSSTEKRSAETKKR